MYPTPHAYDSQKLVKIDSQAQLRAQFGYSKLVDGPISLDITFFMPIPKSLSQKKKDALRATEHFKKPDLSNLIKYVEDVAQGIIFRDDAIISKITARKIYDDTPRTEFSISREYENGHQKKD